MTEKGLLTKVGELIDAHHAAQRGSGVDQTPGTKGRVYKLNWLVPAPGSVIFTLLVIGGLLWGQSVGALTLGAPLAAATSTSSIPYQGRLADGAGAPLTGTYNMIFRLYGAVAGGAPLWEEQWTGSSSVQVSDGLFNVMLGSLTPIPQNVLSSNSNLFLGITVGTDSEMVPRVQLGTVPYAVQALTVPDSSITTAKLEDASVTKEKLAPDAVSETLAILELSTTVSTNSNTIANFGSINLPQKSHVYIMSMWVLSNNSSNLGLSASLVVDGTPRPIYGDVIPMSASGIGYTVARNHYIADLPAGTHALGVKLDQFPFQTGHSIHIIPGSVMWIRIVPAD